MSKTHQGKILIHKTLVHKTLVPLNHKKVFYVTAVLEIVLKVVVLFLG